MAVPLQLVSRHGLWLADSLGQEEGEACPTGYPVLDRQLPGGGWPPGGLVELLQEEPPQHVWQLLTPCLNQVLATQPGPVVLVNVPFEPFVPSLRIAPERLLRVAGDRPKALLWATQQALQCADVRLVLAWLADARSDDLRRLHLASQQHRRLLFAIRPLCAEHESSPARLRLHVSSGDALQVRIVKRRGPPLDQPVLLPAHPPRLAALLRSRQGSGKAAPPLVPPTRQDRSHVVDRAVSLA